MTQATAAPHAAAPDPAILTIADFIADPVAAADFPQTILRWRNDRAAAEIGLALDDDAWLAQFGRFEPGPLSLPQPLALRYHGHQFGTYNPDLGDGRGFLFAQVRDADGRLIDLGTKGSGLTPWSRMGDGRLTLKGAVRELLATEMLAALGVDTSRTLSIVETGEALHRGDEPSPTRSAVLVRQSHGHIRIGSFQRLAYLSQPAEMERLLRYCLQQYTGIDAAEAAGLSVDVAAARLVAFTAARCAATIAGYMVAGFVHGVLNTDNINITGESFDYGPWRFTPAFDPGFVAAYFDHSGLYAFGRQPQVVHWNVGQLAVTLRTIAASEPLVEAMETFAPAYEAALAKQLCWRLGVAHASPAEDRVLVLAVEGFLRASNTSIDAFYASWAGGTVPVVGAHDASIDSERNALVDALAGRATIRSPWTDRAAPVSLPIETVEALWAPIAERDDWTPLFDMVAAIRRMGEALAG